MVLFGLINLIWIGKLSKKGSASVSRVIENYQMNEKFRNQEFGNNILKGFLGTTIAYSIKNITHQTHTLLEASANAKAKFLGVSICSVLRFAIFINV